MILMIIGMILFLIGAIGALMFGTTKNPSLAMILICIACAVYGLVMFYKAMQFRFMGKVYTMIILDTYVRESNFFDPAGRRRKDTYMYGYYIDKGEFKQASFQYATIGDTKYKAGKFVRIRVNKNNIDLAVNKVWDNPPWLSESAILLYKTKLPDHLR